MGNFIIFLGIDGKGQGAWEHLTAARELLIAVRDLLVALKCSLAAVLSSLAAVRCSVVAVRLPGCRDVSIHGFGEYVDFSSPKQLGKAIISLVRNKGEEISLEFPSLDSN